MSPPRAPHPAGALAREWLGALGRLALFGILFVALVEIAGVLAFVWDARGPSAVARGGIIWLAAALGAGALVLYTLDRRSWRALGLAPTGAAMRGSAAGLLLGVAMIGVAVALMLVTADLRFRADAGGPLDAAGAMLGAFAVLLPAAAAEEALFRGYPIQVLARTAGAPLAILTTSAAFAAVHAGNPAVGTLALANIFLAGVLLGVVYLKTASLWVATAVHVGWNWAMGGLFDLPVSGLGWIDVPGFEPEVVGPAWWNGGGFGPEGGVIGTICFVAATVYVLRSGRFGRAAEADPKNRPLYAAGTHD